ncbi:16286_t:CDS:2 [Funneliformis caledonium]|uniref:16286_t:CDS:1 n=1 Tax=Funneliformis caledonium TaxID=1117310 RepID=A0A9N9NIN2_9GLOM|nr:16286_t:CDS:2 [Funneliformis caledonium]
MPRNYSIILIAKSTCPMLSSPITSHSDLILSFSSVESLVILIASLAKFSSFTANPISNPLSLKSYLPILRKA